MCKNRPMPPMVSISGDHRGPGVKVHSSFARMSCLQAGLPLHRKTLLLSEISKYRRKSPCQALLNFLELAKENEKGRDFPLQQQASQPTPTVSAIQSCLIQGTHAMNQISLFQSHILPLPLTRRPSPPSLPSFPLSALLLSCLFPFPCSPASLGHENHKRALAG